MRRIQQTAIDGPVIPAVQPTGTPGTTDTLTFTLDSIPSGSWFVWAVTDTPLELHSAYTELNTDTLECVCYFENKADFSAKITALAVDVEE